ncbi:MAG: hypothetical protein ACLFN1_09855 [Bacteroidales bacterium]
MHHKQFWRSGSTSIEANGYLVDIVPGGEGRPGVIGELNYLYDYISN